MPRPSEALRVRIARRPGNGDLPLPRRATPGSAGCDLCAAVEGEVRIAPGERVLIPTGFSIALPPGYEARYAPAAVWPSITASSCPTRRARLTRITAAS